jgi:hypothetical protein
MSLEAHPGPASRAEAPRRASRGLGASGKTAKRMLVSNGGAMLICDLCVGKAARLLGRQKQQAARRKRRR